MSVNEQVAEALNRNTYIAAKTLQALYMREQLREAERTPDSWGAVTFSLGSSLTQAVQIMPADPSRHEMTLYNVGSKTLLYAPLINNLAQVQAEYLTMQTEGSYVSGAFGTLDAGDFVTIKSRGAMWVCPATAADAVIVQVVFTNFMATKKEPGAGEQYHGFKKVEMEIEHFFKELV